MTRGACGITGAACLAALILAGAGCGSAAPARPASTTVTVAAVPLDTSMASAAGTWATVVMGGSAAQYNNFWQLFVRPSGSAEWKLVTPPGTADNGGLVLAGSSGQALITAFRPSQDLTYTPLTQTSDGGRTWSALSPLDAPLASTPDSLAAQPGTGRLLALPSSGAAEQGTPASGSWTALITARALAATPAGRSCGLRYLTAVAYTPAGAPLLGGTCTRPGTAGIYTEIGRTWQAAGPALTGPLAHQPVAVLRVSTTGNQTIALLAAGTGQGTTLVAAWQAGGSSTWTTSPPLSAGGAVTAASLGPGQTAAVITADGRGAVLAADRWQRLPALPSGTAALALAPGIDGEIDALAVRQSTLTVWQLTSPAGSWTKAQVINVPIQYGSSG
jgi:hypothetical protein